VHRDLKPQNILINEFGEAFVADVGVAKQFESTFMAKKKQQITTIGGDENWMAPEMLRAFKGAPQKVSVSAYHSKLDVFSLGLITLKAIDRDVFRIKAAKLNDNEKALEDYLNDVEKRGIITDPEFLSVLRKMLSFDIDSRISVQDLSHWMVF
jgi:serine/threonine protein kinase